MGLREWRLRRQQRPLPENIAAHNRAWLAAFRSGRRRSINGVSPRAEKQTLCSLLDGSGQEVYLGHTGECKLVTTAAHQVLPTWIGTYS